MEMPSPNMRTKEAIMLLISKGNKSLDALEVEMKKQQPDTFFLPTLARRSWNEGDIQTRDWMISVYSRSFAVDGTGE